jgi:hypothetical protein
MEEESNILKAIPKEVWGAATDFIKQILYPITATTIGVGKLIEKKFKTLNEVQKIIAAQTLKEAVEKTKINDLTDVVVKPQVIYSVLENSDHQIDETMRALWSNLAAREFSEGAVHPEIARLFSKLTLADITTISRIHQEQGSTLSLLLNTLVSSATLNAINHPKSFNHVYLQSLGLIDSVSGKWFCTTTGKELIASISELRVD